MSPLSIPEKANRVLHLILFSFLLILIRVWYLAVVEHETYLELSKKPQKKTAIDYPNRGTIRDRFNIPLAVNKIRYDVAVCYDQIRNIPSIKKTKDPAKGFIKSYPRKEYILKLSALLSHLLNLDALDIEDILYGQASLFPSTQFTLKENISEELFYKIKGLERTYPGLIAKRDVKRFYPQKKVGCDVLGYLGSLNSSEHLSLSSELAHLNFYIQEHEKGHIVFLPKGYGSLHDVHQRVNYLKQKTVHMQEKVGKSGIEAKFDHILRGSRGKKVYEVNTKGSIVRELPFCKKAEPGKRILLNISCELQEYAEALLAENELIRDKKFAQSGKNHDYICPPWIKGGSIVAMIPQTGEIVALASYPRMDTNDFIEKGEQSSLSVHRWLEDEKHLASLWDGKVPLEREFYSQTLKSFYKDEKKLTLEAYLERVLSHIGHGKKVMQKITSLGAAAHLQNIVCYLLDLSEQPFLYALIDAIYTEKDKHHPSVFKTSEKEKALIEESLAHHDLLVKELKKELDKYLNDLAFNDDKLLIFDLLRLIAHPKGFDDELLEAVGADSLATFRKLCQSLAFVTDEVKEMTKETFHLFDFREWRTKHFKAFLANKREIEKEKKTYQKPYIDYLKQEEKIQFEAFWKTHQWQLIKLFLTSELLSPSHYEFNASIYFERFKKFKEERKSNALEASSLDFLLSRLKELEPEFALKYVKAMRTFKDLGEKLYGYYPQIKKRKGCQTEKDLAKAFYPPEGCGFGRSYGFRQATSLGSIFKIITAYEAIKQTYEKEGYQPGKDLNPLTIIDEIQAPKKGDASLVLGFHEDGSKITRHYKGGTLPRSHSALGKIDYVKAFERSSNVYFSLLASDIIEDPNDLSMASLKFGFGNKTGIDLPGEIPGTLPKDLSENRSGLYAFAIGQHSLIVTPLQTAVMLSSLVNDGSILKPQIVQLTAGIEKGEKIPYGDKDYPYKEYLSNIGIFFPFFLETEKKESQFGIKLYEKLLYRKLFLPPAIKEYLLEGLHSVVSSPRGSARAELIRYLYQNTHAMRNYLKLKYQLAGKTSSAEIAYHPTLDRECPKILCKDIWFGGVSFKEEKDPIMQKKQKETPELVVVVYLKFGDFGKEAAPLAAEIITKWREICAKEGKSSFITY